MSYHAFPHKNGHRLGIVGASILGQFGQGRSHGLNIDTANDEQAVVKEPSNYQLLASLAQGHRILIAISSIWTELTWTNHFFTLFLLIVSDCFTLLISAPSRAIVAPRSVSALSGARTVRTSVVQHSLGTEMLRHLNRSRRCNDAVATWAVRHGLYDMGTHTHYIHMCI